jgi:hypothetical protein
MILSVLLLCFVLGGMGNAWFSETINEQRLSDGEVGDLGPGAMPQPDEWSQSILSQLKKERVQHVPHSLENSMKYNGVSEVETQQMQRSAARLSVTLKYSRPESVYTMPVRVGKHNMSMWVATSAEGPYGAGSL